MKIKVNKGTVYLERVLRKFGVTEFENNKESDSKSTKRGQSVS